MNSVSLLGNLTNDVDLRYTASGNPVANFGIAVNRRYRQDDELKQEVTFVDLVAFNRTAEVAKEFLAKGRPAAIEGRLRFRTWETEGGAKRSKLEVLVNRLHLLPRNGKDQDDNGAGEFDGTIPEDSAEIPF
ncbi:MAG: single-stranded DNA-binding protein [Candidatus Tectomicrobia bacterium]|nr:single-stranded DNA-binding protein [Candidatus Tectomicrobia bacterium]